VVGIAPAAVTALGSGEGSTRLEQLTVLPLRDQSQRSDNGKFASILLATLVALPFVTDLAVLGGAFRGVLKPDPSILASFVLRPTLGAIVITILFAFGWSLWAAVVGTSTSYVVSCFLLTVRAPRRADSCGFIGVT
jgi:O-antigen/teichoic acid export membrane protein